MIKIHDLKTSIEFFTSISKIVADMKVTVTTDKTVVCITNETRSLRGLFVTNAITSTTGSTVEFCFQDIRKLIKSMSLVQKIDKVDSITLVKKDIFLQYNGASSFKFTLSDMDSVKHLTTDPIKNRPKLLASFTTTAEQLNTLFRSESIVSEKKDQNKMYIYAKDGKVMGEINDRANEYADSIAFPISDKVDTGSFHKPLSIRLANARNFVTLPTSKIVVGLTDNNFINVNTVYKNNNYIVAMDYYTQLCKR